MNAFVKNQQKACRSSDAPCFFYTFNNTVTQHYSGLLRDMLLCSENDLHPEGMTALFDAIGFSMSNRTAACRQTKVIFVIMTDGHENASKTYTKETVREMIQDMELNC